MSNCAENVSPGRWKWTPTLSFSFWTLVLYQFNLVTKKDGIQVSPSLNTLQCFDNVLPVCSLLVLRGHSNAIWHDMLNIEGALQAASSMRSPMTIPAAPAIAAITAIAQRGREKSSGCLTAGGIKECTTSRKVSSSSCWLLPTMFVGN